MPERISTNESLCVKRTDDSLACGQVIKKIGSSLYIKINKIESAASFSPNEISDLGLPLGESLREQSFLEIRFLDAEERTLDSTNHENSASKEGEIKTLHEDLRSIPTASIAIGLEYVFPMVKYQYLITPKLGLGITALVMHYSQNDRPPLKGFGTLFSFYFYPDAPLQGPWTELGAGGYSLSPIQDSENYRPFSLAVIGHLGWRWKWTEGPGFGFAVGAQYLSVNSNFSTVLPSISCDISFPL
jgi:hypothetical protein